MKTSDLAGELLDYWVSKAEGIEIFDLAEHNRLNPERGTVRFQFVQHCFCGGSIAKEMKEKHGEIFGHWGGCFGSLPKFSSDWAQGGPIIERESVSFTDLTNNWRAKCGGRNILFPSFSYGVGRTHLTAAMRAYVSLKYGDEVPDIEI